MLQRKCKTNHKFNKTKCMNCVVLVIVAILALFIHFVNNYLEEKVKIYPKLSSSGSLKKQRSKSKSRKIKN